jgi:hypothetical protein
MLEYIPRPGSKTETAVAYLRAHGGAATAIDLCEAMDTSRKNLPSQFKAAIDNGLLEACALPDGMGYRLVGIDAPGTKRESPTPRPSSTAARVEPGFPWPTLQHPKPGVGKNPGSERSVATGQTSAEAPAVTAKATPRPKPERRETGPAPASVAAGDVDLIEHPPHYTAHPSGIECIEITEHMGFNLGNAIKYLWRADLKGAAIEDLKKAQWYIARELQKREQAAAKEPA